MKGQKMKKYAYLLLGAAFIYCLLAFTGCTHEEAPVTAPASQDYVFVGMDPENPIICVDLIAGKDIDAGDVCVYVQGENLCITYNTTGCWEMNETHLWVSYPGGPAIPTNKPGNVVPGHFPYGDSNLPAGTVTWTQCLPLSLWGLSAETIECDPVDINIAAHAALSCYDENGELTQTQTGWGYGDPIPNVKNWAMWFTITLHCQEDGHRIVGTDCGTAYGKSADLSHCFLDYPQFPGNNWGWTNGAFGNGEYTLTLYLGAAQCEIPPGVDVGTVRVVYDGSAAIVTFNLVGDYALTNVHLYVGSGMFPIWHGSETITPGHFPIVDSNLSAGFNIITTWTYTVENLSGDIYIIAHAGVCNVINP
jgi:hypothetical protein